MNDIFAMGYALYVYGSYLAFTVILVICTKSSIGLHKKNLNKISIKLRQMDNKNET
jgi:heme exporter protein D|tara:strand:+ start:971 stop:1138 length:168 start_codon:yes stop_codon:yes gene_type:complete